MPEEMGLVKDENISLESNESLATSATSGISEPASSPSGSSSCTKRARTDYCSEQQNRRAFLFNKLVQLMPASMVQPERNLSDFVVMWITCQIRYIYIFIHRRNDIISRLFDIYVNCFEMLKDSLSIAECECDTQFVFNFVLFVQC